MGVSVNKTSPGKMFLTAIYLLIFPTLILFLSGDWLWVEGWIFGLWFIALCSVTILYLYRHDPALLSERYKKPGTGNQKGWDRYLISALVLGFLLWIVLMPLDAERFSWSPEFPVWTKIMGGTGLLLSAFLFYRAYSDNTFLSPLIRIQSERKQTVVSSGIYSVVRHPMYLGGALLFIGTPLLLGSIFGLIVGVSLCFLMAGRTIGEEKMLINELDGYSEYRKKVKYRLIPLIW